jgi:transaldolase
MDLPNLSVRIFADGADIAAMLEMYSNPLIAGFTTNPTLMRAAGVVDYESFARQALELIPDRPICFEVLADEFDEMEAQAVTISSWGSNVYVKVPVSNSRRESSNTLLRALSARGVKVNVTAVMTLGQVEQVAGSLVDGVPSFVSLFAGRIADTGCDPVPIATDAVSILADTPHVELIWASSRELFNVFQADAAGCHVITATQAILEKLPLIGRDLEDLSLETVRMFYEDGRASAFCVDASGVSILDAGIAT